MLCGTKFVSGSTFGFLAKSIAVLALGWMPCFPLPAQAQPWDLWTDWSDTNNPNGVWYYGIAHRDDTGSVLTFDPDPMGSDVFDTHTDSWLPGAQDWTGDQSAWYSSNLSNPPIPGLGKSLGVSTFDFPQGTVGGHTPIPPQSRSSYMAVMWVSPISGKVDISGATWMFRGPPRFDRPQYLTLALNGAPFDDVNDLDIPQQPDTNSSNPLTFSEAGVSVNVGDNIILGVRFKSGTGDYTAMGLTISPSMAP